MGHAEYKGTSEAGKEGRGRGMDEGERDCDDRDTGNKTES